MEKMSNPSAWVISQSIRKKTYQILSASTDDGIASVREYDRICKDLVPSDVAVRNGKTWTVLFNSWNKRFWHYWYHVIWKARYQHFDFCHSLLD